MNIQQKGKWIVQYYNRTKMNILCLGSTIFIYISISQISDKKQKLKWYEKEKYNIIEEYNLMKSQRLNHHFSSEEIPPTDKWKTSQGLLHTLYYHGPRVRP